MNLATEAEVSTRHLSCVETGKSSPSRALVLTLAETLEVPLEDTNRWLMLAGFAPAYRTRGLEGNDAEPVRRAITFLLRHHHPYPAAVVDPGWNVVMANDAQLALTMWLTSGNARRADRSLIHDAPPVAGQNPLLSLFDPAQLQPLVRNLPEFSRHMLRHLSRTARTEPAAAATLTKLRTLQPAEAELETDHALAPPVVIPLIFEAHGTVLRFFSSMTMFGSSVDSVLSSLRVETLFPADTRTDTKIRHLWGR